MEDGLKTVNVMNSYVIFHKPGISCPYNAWNKAPYDVREILKSDGFEELGDDYLSKSRLSRIPLLCAIPLKMAAKIRKDSLVVFQHPYDTSHKALALMNTVMLGLCKNPKTCVIVHDLESRQVGLVSISDEIRLLNGFDLVIVHTQQMKDMLEQEGLTAECHVLGLFDYIVEKQNSINHRKDDGICYAGNLGKSGFLNYLPKISDVRFLLYGAQCDSLVQSDNVFYKGRFSPEDLSSIEGGWGLVWDGDSIEACQGQLGEYLKINSPHKASMYLCARMPLIVPEGSAMAGIVREHGLGIVMDSLTSLGESIAAVTDDEYSAMLDHVKEYADALMHGKNILTAISVSSS